MTRQDMSGILALLKAVWTNHPVTDETVTAYAAALEDIPPEEGRWAALRWVRTAKFFPTPAELRALIAERALALPPAEEAWLEVKRAVRTVGSYGVPAWSTPVLATAMEALGYKEFCLSEMADEPAWRAHFFRLYEGYRDRALQDRRVGVLPAPGDRLRLVGGDEA